MPAPERMPPPRGRPGNDDPAIPPQRGHVSSDVGFLSLADRVADVALVEGLAVDDESAAVAFVRRFQSAVFGLALSITRDRGLAEDVSQEVFVRAWRAAGNYDRRKASVFTWLLTITRNAAIDSVRTRRPIAVADDLLDDLLLGTLSVNAVGTSP